MPDEDRGLAGRAAGDRPGLAQAVLAGLGDLRASEDPQDQANLAAAEALTACARGQPTAALRHARAALDHGLLDHAAHLSHLGDDQAAAAAIGEAADIAARLGCQPLADRADTIQPTGPRTAAS